MAGEEAFDKYHERYDKWFEENDDLYSMEIKALKNFVPKSGVGLEIGVGTGQFAGVLDIEFGVDPVMNMGVKACEKGIKTVCGKGEILPFKDDIFDFALCVTTICFFDDILTSFKEAKRVIKKSGSFVLGFVDKESWLGKKYIEKKKENPFYRDAVFYSVPEVQELLEIAGFYGFEFSQTIIEGSSEVLEGFGSGGFTTIKALV